MASIIWNRPNWGSEGVASAPSSPDVKLVYVQTQPVVRVGPSSLAQPVLSIDLKKSELVGKSLQLSFSAAILGAGTESVSRDIYCFFRNKNSTDISVAASPILASSAAGPTSYTWTAEVLLSVRTDGTYIASNARGDAGSYSAWNVASVAQPMPTSENIVLDFAVNLSAATERFTLEHAHVAILG